MILLLFSAILVVFILCKSFTLVIARFLIYDDPSVFCISKKISENNKFQAVLVIVSERWRSVVDAVVDVVVASAADEGSIIHIYSN